jgi:hypothetical protein
MHLLQISMGGTADMAAGVGEDGGDGAMVVRGAGDAMVVCWW